MQGSTLDGFSNKFSIDMFSKHSTTSSRLSISEEKVSPESPQAHDPALGGYSGSEFILQWKE
jgi:hypothetical protein